MTPTTFGPATICILVVLAGCRANAGGPQTLADARRALDAGLPPSWSVARSEADQLPRGHYWGDWGANYTGPKGVLVVVAGPQPAHMCWQSASGEWHRDPIGHEAIELWLMPATYSQGFWSWVNPHAPPRAPLVYSGGAFKVYGQPSQHTTSDTAIKAILEKAVATGCITHFDVSWSTWRSEIAHIIEKPATP